MAATRNASHVDASLTSRPTRPRRSLPSRGRDAQHDERDGAGRGHEHQEREEELRAVGRHGDKYAAARPIRSPSMSDARATLRELRRTRTKRRLGSTDWYDIAYRVYLFAFAGLVAVVVVSDAIDGLIDDEVDVDVLLAKGPSILGIAVMLAVAMGLRSGADGGPISVETADIRHVLLAPMSRRAVLFTPIWQRLRSMMFSFGLVGAVVGQLVATELVGSRAAWAASCAIYGAIVGALFVGAGVLAHAVHLPRWAASAIGTAAPGMAGGRGVGDLERLDRGHRADRSRPTSPATSRCGGSTSDPSTGWRSWSRWSSSGWRSCCGDRLRLEPLARRGELVSQLRFAATSQDLRTVVLLRRQLRAEAPRNRCVVRLVDRIGERC